ncbi:MAG: hypothetical protein R6U50_03260 [Desulfobacterales bacterium]
MLIHLCVTYERHGFFRNCKAGFNGAAGSWTFYELEEAKVVELLRAAAVLIAAVIMGNWFLSEARRSRREGKPWYAVYLTVPGVIVLLIIVLVPILMRVMHS